MIAIYSLAITEYFKNFLESYPAKRGDVCIYMYIYGENLQFICLPAVSKYTRVALRDKSNATKVRSEK